VVQLGQNYSNSTRVKIYHELGQRIKSSAACPLNQNSAQRNQRDERFGLPQQSDVVEFPHLYLNAADGGKVTVFFIN